MHNVPSCYDYLHKGDGYDTDNAAKFDTLLPTLPEVERHVLEYSVFALAEIITKNADKNDDEIYAEQQAKSWLFLLMQYLTASADTRAEMYARGEMIQHLWEWQTVKRKDLVLKPEKAKA